MTICATCGIPADTCIHSHGYSDKIPREPGHSKFAGEIIDPPPKPPPKWRVAALIKDGLVKWVVIPPKQSKQDEVDALVEHLNGIGGFLNGVIAISLPPNTDVEFISLDK